MAARKRQEYSYHARCWGHEVWVAAYDFPSAKRCVFETSPEIKKLVKKGAPIHIERQGVLS